MTATNITERAWQHAGLDCLVLALDVGHRCGYVRVPDGHPWRELGYVHALLEDVNVHGGLTYAHTNKADDRLPEGYWIGFDCAHLGDCSDPAILTLFAKENRYPPREGDTPKLLPFVVAECERLADQVAAAPRVPVTADDALKFAGIDSYDRERITEALFDGGWEIVKASGVKA